MVSSATPDPDPSNNTSATTAAAAAVDNLWITVTANGLPTVGKDLTYSLTVGNSGPTPDPGPVTVTDPLPAGETFVSAAGDGWTCTATGATVTCSRSGPFAVDATSTITLVVELGAAALPAVADTATVRGSGSDPDLANNASTAAIGVLSGVESAAVPPTTPVRLALVTAPQPLASTGFDLRGWVGGGLLLEILGLALVAISRRLRLRSGEGSGSPPE
jgi:uncharacterized repeat protein (TIGR01451 family)